MVQLIYKPGVKVQYNDNPAIIIKIVDVDLISIQLIDTNVIYTVRTDQVSPLTSDYKIQNRPMIALTDQEWKTAKSRYDIIKPILEGKLNSKQIKEIANVSNIHFTTIYRWIKSFKKYKVISALAGVKRLGGKNKSRLSLEQDEIISDVINEVYLDPSRKSIPKVLRSVAMKCQEKNIKAPHPNTIRNRIKKLSQEEVIRSRFGRKKSQEKFEPIKSSFPGADYPLSVIQIDHTCVDIILVDEHYRKPFRRPYLTLAIDVFSRMVMGFYLSFDPPGEMGTGLCIANAVLGKEIFLSKHGIKSEWPIWGVMNTIHLDNAKEFRGSMLLKACQNYNINIEHRPVATPHWGGHVERLLGTFAKEIHNLSGATFSNIQGKDNYDSVSRASMTINEFEKWLALYIVDIYHKRIHSTINMSPLDKYKEGVFGVNGEIGTGIPPKLLDERRVKLDFMPFVDRTIQEYGVLIDHIYYYDEVLRKYIHSKEDLSNNSKKRKFIFKRDPRDISIIYFYDPEINEYFEVPYRDTSKPPMSIWEFNEVITKLKKGKTPIDEESIFATYRELENIELQAIRETKRLKKFSRYSDKRNRNVHDALRRDEKMKTDDSIKSNKVKLEIKPFEEIDDEAFTS